MNVTVASVSAFAACAALTFVALERATIPPMQPMTAAVVDQVCGFGGKPLPHASETVSFIVAAVQAEPILKRARICAVMAYQSTEGN